jgi:hypothetical protein
MPIKAEKRSKASLQLLYEKSAGTIRAWCNRLRDNYKAFAEKFNDPEYLCFSDYQTNCKTLPPRQYALFKKHYGEPVREIKNEKEN